MKDCTAPFSVQNAIFSFRAAAIVGDMPPLLFVIRYYLSCPSCSFGFLAKLSIKAVASDVWPA